MNNRLLAQVVAEAFGTFVIVLCGTGVVAMVVLFGKSVPGEIVNGGFTNITIAWGLAVTMGVYLTAKISGAHLNPAVTLALAVFRGFPWNKVVPYCLAQITGAFCAAALVYANYRPAFLRHDPELLTSAGVFATFLPFEMPMAGFLDQVIGTAILLLLICALTDDTIWRRHRIWGLDGGIDRGLVGMSFGYARPPSIRHATSGPTFTVLAGFRNNGLTDGQPFLALVAPLIGGLLGAGAYDLCIGVSCLTFRKSEAGSDLIQGFGRAVETAAVWLTSRAVVILVSSPRLCVGGVCCISVLENWS
ncbi:MAG: MIP/aquaporin family protein [Bryobacteraceae bacterium]